MLGRTKILASIATMSLATACSSSVNIDPATSETYCKTMTEKSFKRATLKPQVIEAGKAGMTSMVHFKAIMTTGESADDIIVKGIGPKHISVLKNVYLRLENRGSYLYVKTKANVVATIKDSKIICGPAQLAES